VGTFEIAEAFAQFHMVTCMHKHYSVEEWSDWCTSHTESLSFMAVSSGISSEDFKKVQDILDVIQVPFICLDVANGYSEHVSV
jgi:GMP reductase